MNVIPRALAMKVRKKMKRKMKRKHVPRSGRSEGTVKNKEEGRRMIHLRFLFLLPRSWPPCGKRPFPKRRYAISGPGR